MASLPTDLRSPEQRRYDEALAVTMLRSELEAYRMAVDGVRMFCGVRAEHGPSGVARRVARHVLDLLSDLP